MTVHNGPPGQQGNSGYFPLTTILTNEKEKVINFQKELKVSFEKCNQTKVAQTQ